MNHVGGGARSGRARLPQILPIDAAVAFGRSLPRRATRRILRFAGRHLLGTTTHVHTSAPLAALTFDDGPDPGSTPALLDLLQRHDAKATFFMLGCQARRHPELVKRVAAAGHCVANHSFDHHRFPSLSHEDRRRQIGDCEAALGPYAQKLFRPPHGLQSVASRLDALLLGYDVVTWNVAVEDWLPHPPERIAELLATQVKPGSIVLLHDALYDSDTPAAVNRAATLAGLDLFLSQSSLSFVTVPELLNCGRAHQANWFVRCDADWARHDPS